MSKILLILFLVSCGLDKEEEIAEAVKTANSYLTTFNCDDAIETLTNIGMQNDNADYLQTLASAYACKSDFTEPTFYGTNLSKISSTEGSFVGSLTTFTTSEMTSPSDANYIYLLDAIKILLYAGGLTTPSASGRNAVFTAQEVQDIDLQNLYMIITILGKYFYYYGNADPTNGTKGTGSSANGNDNGLSNGCFYDYDPSDSSLETAIDTVRAAGTVGSCTTGASGHEQLPALPNANTVSRMCEGVVLFNNLIDIITNVEIPTNGGSLGSLNSLINEACSSVPEAGAICNVKDFSTCETDYSTSPNTDKLQVYFFFIFETLFT